MPVSLAEVKAWARIDSDLEDALLMGLLLQAIDEARERTRRQSITATWDAYFDCFPSTLDARGEYSLTLPWSPAQSITSIVYTDQNGVEQTWASTEYRLDSISAPARVVLGYGKSFPSPREQSNAIRVRYVAGYGDRPEAVPEAIRRWIAMRVATATEYREALSDRGAAEVPRPFVDGLLDPYVADYAVG
jgi:uncharacterized phiE125 gp8 family phage protein